MRPEVVCITKSELASGSRHWRDDTTGPKSLAAESACSTNPVRSRFPRPQWGLKSNASADALPTESVARTEDPELLSTWLLPVAGFDVALGKTFVFVAPVKSGWDGRVHCRMERAEAHRYL